MRQSIPKRVAKWILLVMVSVFLLFPVFLIVISSFKNDVAIFNYPPQLIPYLNFKPTFEAYFPSGFQSVLFKAAFSAEWLGEYYNTFFLSLASTGLALLIGMPAAYALATYDMPRKEMTAFSILTLRMTPLIAAEVPLYFLIGDLHLIDTYLGLILVYSLFQLPIVVWLMRGFIEGVPKSIVEAAQVDGASELTRVTRILLPLVRTGLIVTIAFCFFVGYNDFALNSLIGGFNTINVSVGVNALLGEQRIYWNDIFAIATVNLIPTLTLAFALRKYLATGFTLGLVKG
jgi:multiple sugar transport system permease protein